jgi:hypothetical protein
MFSINACLISVGIDANAFFKLASLSLVRRLPQHPLLPQGPLFHLIHHGFAPFLYSILKKV